MGWYLQPPLPPLPPLPRFLLALVDESAGVRQLATYLLGDSLAAKAPLLAYNHFIESLFVLNDCTCVGHGAGGRGGRERGRGRGREGEGEGERGL